MKFLSDVFKIAFCVFIAYTFVVIVVDTLFS